jgi:hypothetical protein
MWMTRECLFDVPRHSSADCSNPSAFILHWNEREVNRMQSCAERRSICRSRKREPNAPRYAESRGRRTPALTKRRRRRETAPDSVYRIPHDAGWDLTPVLRQPYGNPTLPLPRLSACDRKRTLTGASFGHIGAGYVARRRISRVLCRLLPLEPRARRS